MFGAAFAVWAELNLRRVSRELDRIDAKMKSGRGGREVTERTPETSRELDARFDKMTFEERRAECRLRNRLASEALRPRLKAGDRLRANKAECCAREATFTFSHWEGGWIVSTGGSSISPASVYSINKDVFRV